VSEALARQVVVTGTDAEVVAAELVERLRAPSLRIVFLFADWQLDPAAIARVAQRGLTPAPIIGSTTVGVIGPEPASAREGKLAAAALGLYGDWVRVGVGVASELPRSPLTRSRDAVEQAAAELGTTAPELHPTRHAGITVVGRCGHEEAFCIGSAATVPQIRMIGGTAATEVPSRRTSFIYARGEVLADAGAVVLLESELPFSAVTSSHLQPTDVKTVVTNASGRVIVELDGRPAARRLQALVAQLGDTLDLPRPSRYAFARYVDGVPYVRTITRVDDERIMLASSVETGHVLRLMRPGDLLGTTRRDLATAAERVGGVMAALLAVSCIGRHWEAAMRGIERELDDIYRAYPTIGYQSFGEQSGMLLVNHTLTGLAIGARR
jgi:hypothetical protein